MRACYRVRGKREPGTHLGMKCCETYNASNFSPAEPRVAKRLCGDAAITPLLPGQGIGIRDSLSFK